MRRQLAATAILSGTIVAGSLMGTGVAFAAPSTCEAYSTECPPEVLPTTISKPPVQVEGNSTTLPFTGGEVALMSIAGIGAIGAGTAFVVAGRRRKHA
jgi:LPXTG-motif cell wall-anchored protein